MFPPIPHMVTMAWLVSVVHSSLFPMPYAWKALPSFMETPEIDNKTTYTEPEQKPLTIDDLQVSLQNPEVQMPFSGLSLLSPRHPFMNFTRVGRSRTRSGHQFLQEVGQLLQEEGSGMDARIDPYIPDPMDYEPCAEPGTCSERGFSL